jgi:hypothetical protein
MKLTDEDLEEFRAIYKAEFNETIDIPEARAMASDLIELYMMLAKPLPSEIAAHEAELEAQRLAAMPPADAQTPSTDAHETLPE